MTTTESRLKHFLLSGQAGDVEVLVEEMVDIQHEMIALVCHPHPLFGGTMHNKVVHRLAATMHQQKVAVARFNFRGVGKSKGTHDNGVGEVVDAQLVLHFLRQRHPQAQKCIIAGFSFGAYVAAKLAYTVNDSQLLLMISPAVSKMDFSFLCDFLVPKFVIQGTKDDICPVTELLPQFATWSEPKNLQLIEGANHFYDRLLTSHFEAALKRIFTFL